MRRKIEKQGNILRCYDTYIKRYGAYCSSENQNATSDKTRSDGLIIFAEVSVESKGKKR